jgi:integrase
MLLSRRTESYEPEALVFTSARGEAIDDHNFRNRAWKSVLQELGIDYRSNLSITAGS